MTRLFCLFALTAFSFAGFAQELQVTDLSKEVKSTKELYQPQFSDKTLLFFSKDVVWTCKYEDEIETTHKYFNTDFAKMKECQCHVEKYQLVPTGKAPNGVYADYTYKVLEKGLKANLVNVNDSLMTYTEFSDDGGVKKSVDFKYNLEQVVATDSLYSNGECCDMELIIRKSIKFEKQ